MLWLALAMLGFASAIAAQTPLPKCPFQEYQIVSDFDPIKAGEVVSLEVRIKDGEKVDGEVTWTVSMGTIVSGQLTSHIQVLTPSNALERKPVEIPKDVGENGMILHGGMFGRPRVHFDVTAALTMMTKCEGKPLARSIEISTRSIPPNRPAIVTDVLLDSTELTPPCGTMDSSENAVDVSVKAADPDDDPLVYLYTVSAGKIIGRGANVKWDVSGVPPGQYEITVGADDGCGICGKTVKKVLTITKCPDRPTRELLSSIFP